MRTILLHGVLAGLLFMFLGCSDGTPSNVTDGADETAIEAYRAEQQKEQAAIEATNSD